MSKRSCRIYFCTHEDGTKSGILMSRAARLFSPDPSAYGVDEAAVELALESQLVSLCAGEPDELDRFLWEETFETRLLRLDVPVATAAHGRFVIGARTVPLQVTYAFTPLEGGGYRVLAPRFELSLVLEDLTLAADVLRHALTNQLLGEAAHQLYDLRPASEESVREWTPLLLRRRRSGREDHDGEHTRLAHYADELVARARTGQLAPVLGERPVPVRSGASILLVGPVGVGKSAWVRALAHALARTESEGTAKKLWSTSRDRILAGLPYLGQWQARCLELVRELEHEGDYLHLDHLHAIVQPIYGEASIADFLDEPVREGALSLILEATDDELERARRLHPAFIARLSIVRVHEPSTPEVIELIAQHGERRGSPKLHALSYKRLLRHLEVFARTTALPGKALRFMEWLASLKSELPELLHPSDLSRAYARYAGVPHVLLAEEEAKSRQQFAAELATRVIGQSHACDVAARALARLKAGMSDPARPVASFLFVGPTGVGKTELAKQLTLAAFGSAERTLRFDMSEYMFPGSASRLLDPTRGVRSLVNAVRTQPLALVLLDEIEKAHPQVFDLLLSVLDEGRLTDASGNPCDLRSTMIVLTSNLGVRDRPSVGFDAGDEGDSLRAVRVHFRPELWNRIDYVVPFRALSLADVERIVRLELTQLEQREGLRRRNIRVRASEAAIAKLARDGHDPLFGARPLKRRISDHVVAPIAARLSAEPSLRAHTVAVVTSAEQTQEAWIVRV